MANVTKTIKNPEKPAMAELKVRSRFIKTPPDKLRFVSKAVLGKEVNIAIGILSFLPQVARRPLVSVLKAGLSQAKDRNISAPLYIKAIAVDVGPKLKRRRIVHQGRATSILKRMSHITIYLTDNVKSKSQISNSKTITNNKYLKKEKNEK